MKKIVMIMIGTILVLSSCTTTKESSQYRSFGSINRPTIDVQVDIKINQNNLIELGKIDEVIEYTQDQSASPSINNGDIAVYKLAYISNLITKDDGLASMREKNPALFDEAIGELAGQCIVKYPDMDYILFPKIYVEIGSENSMSNIISRYKMRLTGTAVQLKF
jgi:hypothetical protein